MMQRAACKPGALTHITAQCGAALNGVCRLQAPAEARQACPEARQLLAQSRAAIEQLLGSDDAKLNDTACAEEKGRGMIITEMLCRSAGRFAHHVAAQNVASQKSINSKLHASGKPSQCFAQARELYQGGDVQQAMHRWAMVHHALTQHEVAVHPHQMLLWRAAYCASKDWVCSVPSISCSAALNYLLTGGPLK